MTSDMSIHQRNLESNILFMQQQHADTLKALHAEIAKLQKRCSDATYQLTLQMPELEKEEKERMLKEHTEKVIVLQRQRDELLEKMQKKERHLKLLEQQLKAQEKNYLDQLKGKNLTISKLHDELESKSNQIAYLTTELHKNKLKQHRTGSGNSRSSSESLDAPCFEPSPPQHGRPKVRHIHKIDSASVNKCQKSLINEPRNRVRGVTDSPRVPSIPDPAPFLRRESTNSMINMDMRSIHPLPPIAGRDALDELKTRDYDIVFHPSCAPQANLTSVSAKEQIFPEVETLAIDQLSVVGHPWQPASTQSSEFH